jgi:alanyl-tRNA synthetase
MKAKEVRNIFLSFFEKNKGFEHVKVESSSLVPANDRTVLFSIAGMQQFKSYFLGDPSQAQKELGLPRATSVQKCFRVADIDSVGDSTHLTFFEMLGNFSFNDYFKKEAIAFALELITKKFHLDAQTLWVTYFGGDKSKGLPADTETHDLWIQAGIQEDRIVARGSEDNLWGPPGATGPCGPSTEIHCSYPGTHCNAFEDSKLIEIWNIVLMQYEKNSDGTYKELASKNIDTGMGLERISMIIENKQSVFETSLFESIQKAIISDPAFSAHVTDDTKRLRVASDHLRSTVFLLSDNVSFGKKEQQAVLRRIFRKALDQYENKHANLAHVLDAVIKEYHQTYPIIKEKREYILRSMQQEQEMYYAVRDRKVAQYLKKISPHRFVQSQIEPLEGPSARQLSSEEAFTLITTYGFSLEQLKKEGYSFEKNDVLHRMSQHKEKSKQGSEKKFGGHGLDSVNSINISKQERTTITRLHTATHLLHAALRKILGDSVSQQGSDINSERLRFDFSFSRKLTEDEKAHIEKMVNEVIEKDYRVKKEILPLQKALEGGAMAFFREKYPDPVSVYTVFNPETSEIFSCELCGGPHVSSTKEIGKFTIISEKSVSQGTRRIRAKIS